MVIQNFPEPLQILVYTLFAVTVTAAAVMVSQWRHRSERSTFDLAGLILVGCLLTISFLSGFSIGKLLAIANIGIAIILAFMVRRYKIPFVVLALASLFLAIWI